MVGHNLLTLSSRLAELHVACQGISSDQLPQICWAAVCRCGLIEGSEVKVNEQSFGAKLTWSEACLQLLLDVHQGTWLWTLFSVTWRYHHSQLMWCKPPAPPCMVQMVSGTPPICCCFLPMRLLWEANWKVPPKPRRKQRPQKANQKQYSVWMCVI